MIAPRPESAAPASLPAAIDWDTAALETARLLSRYIQFDTTNPPGHEAAAIDFLAGLLRQRGFEPTVLLAAPQRANLIVRLPAQPQATAPPCLLYAHADVVPADPAQWSVPPFEGRIQDGFVWGRGALDDKSLGVIFLQALSLLRQANQPRRRDIILLIAADEEQCGGAGVAWLLRHHPHLLRAEFVWDEGGVGLLQADQPPLYQIAVTEKIALTVKLTAHGTPGHASVPRPDNPHNRLVRALHRIQQWPQPVQLTDTVTAMLGTQAQRRGGAASFVLNRAHWPPVAWLIKGWLSRQPHLTPLVRNTVNLTMLTGGQASNISPARSEARLDVRLLPNQSPALFMQQLAQVISDDAVQLKLEGQPPPAVAVPSSSRFFQTLAEVVQSVGPPGLITPYLTPGATDSRFFRAAGMQAYGFMPMLLTGAELSRIHGVDERVSIENLKWGLQVVFETLSRL